MMVATDLDPMVLLEAGIDLAAKATALILLGLAAHAALGNRASARSAAWNAVVAGLLLLPLTAALPRIPVACLPAAAAPASSIAPPPPIRPSEPDRPPFRPEPLRAPVAPSPRTPVADRRDADPIARTNARTMSDRPTPSAGLSRVPAGSAWVLGLLAAYALGVVGLLARLAGSLAGLAWLRGASAPATAPVWVEGLARCRGRLGISGRVSLRTSEHVQIPATFGWLRPAIVLPRALADGAEPGVVEAVLLHELAHIRRGDFAWNLLLRLAQALYWPHPLVWLTGQLARVERERACDDFCVYTLRDRTMYRSTLIDLAGSMQRRRPGPSLGLAMARATGLAGRIRHIDGTPGARLCRPRGPFRRTVLLAALILTALVGPLEPTAAVRATPPPPQAAAEPQPAPAAPRPPFEVLVVDQATGRPIPGATIRAFLDPHEKWFTTGDDGVARGLQVGSVRYIVTLDAWADGYQYRRHYASNEEATKYEPLQDRVTIALSKGELTVGGRVIDQEDRPIPGVTVVLDGYRAGETRPAFFDLTVRTDADGRWSSSSMPAELGSLSVSYQHPDFLTPIGPSQSDQQSRTLEEQKAGIHVARLERGVRMEGRVLDRDGEPIAGAVVKQPARAGLAIGPATTTDVQGRFVVPTAANPGHTHALIVTAPGREPHLESFTAAEGMPPLEFRLGPGHTIRGLVVDHEGKPVPDGWVIARGWRGWSYSEILMVTDADGRFTWNSAPADPIELSITAEGSYGDSIIVTAGPEEVLWKLSPVYSAELTVVDAESREPIKRFEITKGRVDADGKVVWDQDATSHRSEFHGRGYMGFDALAPGWKFRITAQGYEPLETRVIRPEKPRVYLDLELRKLAFGAGGGPSGVVVDVEGKPLAGAEVAMATGAAPAMLFGDSWWTGEGLSSHAGVGTVVADDEGRFTFLPTDVSYRLGAAHESGFGDATKEEFERTRRIVVHPWGRIEGRARAGLQPLDGVTVQLDDDQPFDERIKMRSSISTTTDRDGRFSFHRVKPGPIRLWFGRDRQGIVSVIGEVKPGETTRIEVGGTGRPVVGRVVLQGRPPGQAFSAESTSIEIATDKPQIPYPENLTHDQRLEWVAGWWNSPEGKAYRLAYFQRGAILDPDGTFRIEDVPAGDYVVFVNYLLRNDNGRSRGRVEHRFRVGPIPGGQSDEPIDLGVLNVTPSVSPAPLKAGEKAPDFAVETVDGKPLRLADFKGKYVLLDFWATWCGPCIAEFPNLRAVGDAYAGDDRLAMVSLSLDDTRQAVADFLAARGDLPPTIQGYLGPWSDDPVSRSYGVTAIPATFLIGPDGTIVATGLRGDGILATVRGAIPRR